MTRARRWLLGVGATIIALLVLLAIALAWLLYTPSGLRFALDRGVALTHGQFTYASASGTLVGETTLGGLRYRNADGTTLQVQHATLDLHPWALLTHRLHVSKARIDGITLDLVPSNPSSESGPFSLQPPLTLVLDDTLLMHVAVTQNGNPVFAADSLAISALWSSSRLVIRKLALRAPVGSANLEGTLALARDYPGHGSATFNWTQDGVRYGGKLVAQSDGKTAHLDGMLTSPMSLKLAASLALDSKHAWTLTLDAPRFDAHTLPTLPQSLHALALNLRGTGDAHGGKLIGSLTANDHVVLIDPAQFSYDSKVLKLDPLRLRSPTMPGVVSASGSVQLAASPVTAALDLGWRDVQLPADLMGQPLATHGEAHLTGSAKQFALKGALAIGPPGRLTNVQIDLAGTPQAIQLNTVKLVQKQGGLDAHGSIGLQPYVTWNLAATADKFDPGALLAGWEGALHFALASTGTLTPQGPDATLQLDKADGTLRGRSITGSKADLRVMPDNLLDGSLLLVAGRSRIQARGTGGKQTNATIDLDIASLGDWLPNAAGALQGRFTAKGIWPKLAVNGQLHGEGLSDGSHRINQLQLTAAIPDTSKPGGNLDLALNGVHAAGLDLDSVRVEGRGNAAAHHLQVTAHGKPLGFALALQGSWQSAAKNWTGTLGDFELTPQGMPAWRQQSPASIAWQNGKASLSQLCLSAGTPTLCLSGSRDTSGVLTAHYDLRQLPLQLLASFAAGANPLQASGDISGTGRLAINTNGELDGRATLAVSAGNVAFASTANQPLLEWSSIALDANATGQDLQATLHGALSDGGHLDGTVGVHGSARTLGGDVDVDLRSLAFLSALSPEIANVKGTLTGKLQLGGTLSAPQFSGDIHTNGFSAELPRASLKLHDGQFVIAGDPQGHLAIRGQIASGQGLLHVDGSTGLAADAPLTLDLKGDDLLVADIPAAHVLASPDLHITRANGVFQLTGSVTIPSAKVEAEKLPGQGPAKASPDVVIVDAPPTAPVAPLAVNANIDVKLGDDVKLHGYGLDGSVHGQLAVQVRPGQAATGRGEIRVAGKYEAYGQNLDIERGRLLFASTPLDNPGLDIRAVRQIRSQDITVGLSVRGTAQRPVLSVFSNPTMEQAEALSYLVTGRPLDALKSGEGDTLNTAAQALGGLAGDRLAKSIGSRLGLEAGVSSSEALGGSAFTAGKYLSPRLFLSYGVGLFTPGQVITLRYTLNRFLQFEAENATTGNRASLNYRIEK